MAEHLSESLFARYRQPDISPEELLTADQHLEACAACRQRLLALQLSALPTVPLRRAAAPVDAEHLTYERMAALVKGELSVEEHRQTEAHLKTCPECAWQVGELRAFAATISPYKRYQPPVSAWGKFLAFWRTPQVAYRSSAPVENPAPAAYVGRVERASFLRRPLLQGAVAFALLLLVAGIVWQWRKPEPQVAQQLPSPAVTPEPRLGSTPVTTPAPPSPRTAAPSVFAMTLAPLRARGSADSAGRFNLPATTTGIKITLTEIVKADADGNAYQRYVVALDQQTRKLPTNVSGGSSVQLTLSAGSLSNGRHKLTLYGITKDGTEEALREYPFSITGRK